MCRKILQMELVLIEVLIFTVAVGSIFTAIVILDKLVPFLLELNRSTT
jgi:hypothetical protein